jgi:hypothetical protein
MLIFAEGEKLEKIPGSKGENQQETQLTCDAESRSRTEITVVRGERLAATPPMLPSSSFISYQF